MFTREIADDQQKILNKALMGAVLNEDVTEVRRLLNKGAQVVDFYVPQSNDDDELSWLNSNIDIEKISEDRLPFSDVTNAIILAIQKGNKGIEALLQANNPTRLSLRGNTMQQARAHGIQFVDALNDPTKTLDKISYPRDLSDLNNYHIAETEQLNLKDIETLNQFIAVLYKQAINMINSVRFYTIGKKAKANRIINHLAQLKNLIDDSPERIADADNVIDAYINIRINSVSLDELLKEKRYANPTVFVTDSWSVATKAKNELIRDVPPIVQSRLTDLIN